MDEFDYIRDLHTYLNVRTPSTALRAISIGVLPAEAYTYKANSIKPLFEEPFDLDEIERVLAREDSDIQTNLLLMRILEKLIKHDDAEIALFAAESINTIENRYNKEIERLKVEFEKEEDPSALRKLADLYYELALLNSKRRAIRNFYLEESFSFICKIQDIARLNVDDTRFLVRVLLELKRLGQAKRIIQQVKDIQGEGIKFRILEAEAEFYAGNFSKVFEIFMEISKRKEILSKHELDLLEYWSGE